MLSTGLVLTVFFTIISGSTALIAYTSTTLDQSIQIFDNPIFFLEISDNNNKIYLATAAKIIETYKLRLNIMMERFDGVTFFIPDDPILLCDLLEEEARNQDSILFKLQFSRIFHMKGMHCPLFAGKKKLMPFTFPPHVELHNDIGCGVFNCKVTIESCNEEMLQSCMLMISSEIIVNMQAKHCSNTLM